MTPQELTFRPVDRGNWQDLDRLFEARGGPKYCWCMAWRRKPPEAKGGTSKSRNAVLKSALHARVMEGVPVGILAYQDGVAIAWCSVGPRPTFRSLGGLSDESEDPESVWSLVCFFAKREARGRQISAELLQAAIAYAREEGAKVLEAYPVDPDSPSYRFMGLVDRFKEAGFEAVGSAGSRRYVVRLSLG